MEEVDELILDIIESLRNNTKEPNEDTRHPAINKDLTSVTT